MPPADRTDDLNLAAVRGALGYLRMARESLACVSLDGAVSATASINDLTRVVEHIQTRLVKKTARANGDQHEP